MTITITGTNDAPTIVGGSAVATGGVTEDQTSPPAAWWRRARSAFQDVDLIDTHTASAVFTSSTSSAALPGFADSSSHIGTFAIDPSVTENNTDTINTGSLGWSFTLADNDPVLQSLAQGETITQVYTVTLDDNHGAHGPPGRDHHHHRHQRCADDRRGLDRGDGRGDGG